MRARSLTLLALAPSSPTHAQDSERALLIVDPGNAESMDVANHDRASRDIPASDVIYMDPRFGSASFNLSNALEANFCP